MIITIVSIICALLLLFLFLLMPGESTIGLRAPFWGLNIAHRGLHTGSSEVPENSLAAFTAAVTQGYGIEMDIQLSKDGEVVVFHDDTLDRMCASTSGMGNVIDCTYEEIQKFRLKESDEKIPLLTDVLKVVNERVPLVIELKSSKQNKQLCEKAWAILRQYDGDFCIESFDPRIVRWFKKHVPGVLRGQLSAQTASLDMGFAGIFLSRLFANFLGRPQFIAYEIGDKPWSVRFADKFAMRVAWTAIKSENASEVQAKFDAVIFERYLPQPVYKEVPIPKEKFELAMQRDLESGAFEEVTEDEDDKPEESNKPE